MTPTIRELQPSDAAACDAIIRRLPAFFGHQGGIAACAQAVRTESGWVAVEDGGVVGFATWTLRTAVSAEITWMAVDPDRRHCGIGTAILAALLVDLQARGVAVVLVMTAATADSYAATRRFWQARRFLPLLDLPLWETDQALLLVRPLPSPSPV